MGFPSGAMVKNTPANAVDTGDAHSISGSGKIPGTGIGNPLQYSCLVPGCLLFSLCLV